MRLSDDPERAAQRVAQERAAETDRIANQRADEQRQARTPHPKLLEFVTICQEEGAAPRQLYRFVSSNRKPRAIRGRSGTSAPSSDGSSLGGFTTTLPSTPTGSPMTSTRPGARGSSPAAANAHAAYPPGVCRT